MKLLRLDLLEEVARFKQWTEANPGLGRDWESYYPEWIRLWTAVEVLLEEKKRETWTEAEFETLLFTLARDHTHEHVVHLLAMDEERLIEFATRALPVAEHDAKWQLASRLGLVQHQRDAAETLLLVLADDEDDVRRRALLALAELQSGHTEAVSVQAWNTGELYARIAALSALHRVGSPKLESYLKEAHRDGRTYLVAFADQIAEGPRP
ncbi:MAG: HEAT repeat domain-containing protein [Bacteroidota bacterium]